MAAILNRSARRRSKDRFRGVGPGSVAEAGGLVFHRSAAPLYELIVRDIEDKIRKEQLHPGDPILSTGQMCDYYQVSAITAKAAIATLRNRGMVNSIKGKGCFVAGTPTLPAPDASAASLQRVAMYTANPGFLQPRRFYAGIWESIEEAVQGRGLEFRMQTIPARGSHHPVDFAVKATPEEGLIFLSPFFTPHLLSIAQSHAMRVVWIDEAYAYVHCVLTDNLDGIRQLVDHLQQLGHRSFLMACQDPVSPNPTNENERSAAFRFLMQERGLTGEVMRSANERTVLERVRRANGPTAILFTQDDPAIRFIRAARGAGIGVPEDVSVTGFDDWARAEEELNGLTTLHVDRPALGRRAVEVLCAEDYFDRAIAEWVRVPGQLKVRSTTGPPSAGPKRGRISR